MLFLDVAASVHVVIAGVEVALGSRLFDTTPLLRRYKVLIVHFGLWLGQLMYSLFLLGQQLFEWFFVSIQ